MKTNPDSLITPDHTLPSRWLIRSISGWLALSLCLFPLSAATIDLSKPVSESLKPDGIYWAFDNGTRGDSYPVEVEDTSGNNYDGRLREGKVRPLPVYDEGKFGLALRFPALPEDFEYNPRNPNPAVIWRLRDTPEAWDETKLDMEGKSFTGGLWMKLDKILEGQRQVIVLFVRGSSPRQWGFVLVKEPTDDWTFRFARCISPKTQELNDGAWHHVAFVVDAEGDASFVSFWLDGQRLGEPIALEAPLLAPETDSDRFFILGESNVGNFSTGFEGLLDDVFVTGGVHTFEPPTLH